MPGEPSIYSHRIRLRGPWQVQYQLASSMGNPVQQRTFQIRQPADWLAGFNRLTDDSVNDSEAPVLSESIVYSRRFHWTFPEPASDLFLVITQVQVRCQVLLNQHLLAEPALGENYCCAIHSMVERDNQIQLSILDRSFVPQPPQVENGGTPPFEEVYLAIK